MNLTGVKSLPEESHVQENAEPKSIYFDCRCLERDSRSPNSIPAAVEITHYHVFVGQHTVMNSCKYMTHAVVSEIGDSGEKSIAICTFFVLLLRSILKVQIVLFQKYN